MPDNNFLDENFIDKICLSITINIQNIFNDCGMSAAYEITSDTRPQIISVFVEIMRQSMMGVINLGGAAGPQLVTDITAAVLKNCLKAKSGTQTEAPPLSRVLN